MIGRALGRLAGEELTLRENIAEYGLWGTLQAMWVGVRLWWRPPGVVLWGSNRMGLGWDRQYGSQLDHYIWKREMREARQRQAQREFARRMTAATVQINVAFRDALTPMLRDAQKALAAFGKAYGEAVRKGAAGAGRVLTDAGMIPPDERS